MRLKLFRAATVAAAMAQVRGDLGPDALILATRRVGGVVEVTAALEAEAAVGPSPAAGPIAPASAAVDPARVALLRWHRVPEALAASLVTGAGTGALEAALAARLRFGALEAGRPLLLAGPPGAGKTLTVARLATRMVVQGHAPMVITTDAERAGAAEQLAAFTRVLGLVLVAASDAVMLSRAMARRPAGAAVLIDTAGIDPFSAPGQGGIAALAAASGAQTALVLPAGLDAAESADMAAAFKAAGASMLVATRLDVARRLGGVLTAAAAGLTLTEAGTGPGAADGLQAMTPALLAERLAEPNRRAA